MQRPHLRNALVVFRFRSSALSEFGALEGPLKDGKDQSQRASAGKSSPDRNSRRSVALAVLSKEKAMSNREAEPPRQPGLSRPTGRLKTMLLREDLIIAIMSGMLAWVITLGLKMGFAGL